MGILVRAQFYQDISIVDVTSFFAEYGDLEFVNTGKRVQGHEVHTVVFLSFYEKVDAEKAVSRLDGRTVLNEVDLFIELIGYWQFTSYKYKIGHKNRAFIGDLPVNVSLQALSDALDEFGAVHQLDLIEEFSPQREGAYAVIFFKEASSLKLAIGSELVLTSKNNERKITVQKARAPKKPRNNAPLRSAVPKQQYDTWSEFGKYKSTWGFKN